VAAQAATDSELCAIPNTLLTDILGRNPKVEDAMYKQTLDKLDQARHWMLSVGRKTALEKVASLILMFVMKAGPASEIGYQCDLPLTRAGNC
jgi:CRP/FNR family transcriptional regulator